MFSAGAGIGYNPFTALNAAKRQEVQGSENAAEAKETRYRYSDILNYVQGKITETEDYMTVLNQFLESKNGGDNLKNIIRTLLQRYAIPLEPNVIEEYLYRIYEDMTGFGILSQYLEDPDVEEINVYGPGPKQIEIISSTRGAYMLDEGFPDATSVLNLVKRAVRKGGMTLDMQTPRVDSYLGGGVRISAMIPPIVPEEKGAVASIRKQTKAQISKEAMLNSKMATADEFELLELCMRNKISGAVIGPTGSGKTTLLNYLISDYTTNNTGTTRVYVIEESRELQLPSDARVFYTAVTGDVKNGSGVSAPDLLLSALRFHPTFITCAEMRGEEALNAMNAAQTGHVVWSTFHADSGKDAYLRLLTMCMMSGTTLSENLLLRNLVKAFPIIVSSQQLKDGTRKITGIYEADDVEGTNVIGHYIYHLEVSSYEYDKNGKVVAIHGAHRRCGDLSDRLAQRIFDECGQRDRVAKFARPDWVPESDIDTDTEAAHKGVELTF